MQDNLKAQVNAQNASVDAITATESGKVKVTCSSQYPDTKLYYGAKGIPSFKVLDTTDNLEFLLELYGVNVRYNLMTRMMDFDIPELANSYDMRYQQCAMRIHNLAILNEMPTKMLHEHIEAIALRHKYHPIIEVLDKTPWDGVDRLEAFLSTITVCSDYNADLAKRLILKWLVSAVAAARSINGFTSQGVLVLQGAQGKGKTSWFKQLDPINCGAVREGVHLDLRSKDDIIKCMQNWIIELGELDSTMSKSHAGRLKSFITSGSDLERKAYARNAELFIRRSVFGASVNEENFLIDTTGNRRFWVIPIEKIDINHGLNMLQIWAQIDALFRDGFSTTLDQTDQDMVNNCNEQFEERDPLEDAIYKMFDWDSPVYDTTTITEILEGITWVKVDKSTIRRAAHIIRKLNGGLKCKRNKKTTPVFVPKKRL